jgi:hypothetical protein
MGGWGSGNRERWSKKDTVEDCLTIDANRWKREGILKASVCVAGSWQWTFRSGRRSSISYDVCALDMNTPYVRLSYSWTRAGSDPQSENYIVRLTTTRPNYGGLRWWFVCPLFVNGRACERRVAKLHLPPGGRFFGCRHCHDLTYTSCQESHKDDAFYRHSANMMGVDFEVIKAAFRYNSKR